MARRFNLPAGLLFLAFLVGVAAVVTRWSETRLNGAAVAIDGDSIRLGGEDMRLVGIDAPELSQVCQREGRPWRCGLSAKAALERELAQGEALCIGAKRDRYRRLLVKCSVGGVEINGLLVRQGQAVAYGAYEREEAEARDAKRGLWAGSFERPQDWRAEHPRPAR